MRLSWEEFEKELYELAKIIRSETKGEGYEIHAIVGIVRGGMIPARMLSSVLGVKQIYCLNVEKLSEGRREVKEILDDFKDMNILLVEDMLETGRSMEVAREYLKGRGANVKTVCLYTMSISKITPDYRLRQVDGVVEFPWESWYSRIL